MAHLVLCSRPGGAPAGIAPWPPQVLASPFGGAGLLGPAGLSYQEPAAVALRRWYAIGDLNPGQPGYEPGALTD